MCTFVRVVACLARLTRASRHGRARIHAPHFGSRLHVSIPTKEVTLELTVGFVFVFVFGQTSQVPLEDRSPYAARLQLGFDALAAVFGTNATAAGTTCDVYDHFAARARARCE
jgi:hypothetical protein